MRHRPRRGNLMAAALYAASYLPRRRGRHRRGVALGMAGAAAASSGGHLSFRRAAGVNDITDVAQPHELDGRRW
jgi:hypothetical protein